MYIYILTDSNRTNFKYGITNSEAELRNICLNQKLNQLANNNSWRLVYCKEYNNTINAQLALSDFSYFTRMQIERLIRKSNPNWHNLLETSLNRYANTITSPEQSSNQMYQI